MTEIAPDGKPKRVLTDDEAAEYIVAGALIRSDAILRKIVGAPVGYADSARTVAAYAFQALRDKGYRVVAPPSTRDKIDAERARRKAVGEAFGDVMAGGYAMSPDSYTAPHIGDRLVMALRTRGYDVVKIEGGE